MSSMKPSQTTISPDGESGEAGDNIQKELRKYAALESRVTIFERNPEDEELKEQLFTAINAHIRSISDILANKDTDLAAADPEYRDELQRAEQENERSGVLLQRISDAMRRAAPP